MEDILDLYEQPWNPDYPLVGLDEKLYQLIEHGLSPLPTKPGKVKKEDYTYERNGTCNLFMMVAPKARWRHVKVTDQRTAKDYAQCIKELVDIHFPNAKQIRIVQDNLNTHIGGSLYETFPPEEARRLLRKIEFHYTPKHASWLNMAEIELAVLGKQCINRRIGERDILDREISAWENERNQNREIINWQFTTKKAREKMKRSYPLL